MLAGETVLTDDDVTAALLHATAGDPAAGALVHELADRLRTERATVQRITEHTDWCIGKAQDPMERVVLHGVRDVIGGK